MDITMCEGNNCDLANTCLRHIAQPNEYRQAYFTDNPNKSNTECDYYLKIKEDNTEKKIKKNKNKTI